MLDVTNTKKENQWSKQNIYSMFWDTQHMCLFFIKPLSKIYHHQILFKRLFNKKSKYILYTIHWRYTLQYLNASRFKQLFLFCTVLWRKKYMANQHILLFIKLWVSNLISMYSFNFFVERVLFQKWEEISSMIINVLMKEPSTVVKIKWY